MFVSEGAKVVLGDVLVGEDGEALLLEQAAQTGRQVRAHEQGRRQIGAAIESFAENTMSHIREERDLLLARLRPRRTAPNPGEKSS